MAEWNSLSKEEQDKKITRLQHMIVGGLVGVLACWFFAYTYIRTSDGRYKVLACSEEANNCYQLEADVSGPAIPDLKGYSVDRLYFNNGGFVDMACVINDIQYGDDCYEVESSNDWEIGLTRKLKPQ